MGGEVHQPALEGGLLDGGRGGDGADRQAAAERLGQRHEVGHDAGQVHREHGAEPAEPGLGLVQDEQHAALAGQLGQPGEVAGRRHHDPAGRQHGLGDDGGSGAGGLFVVELEADLQAGHVAGVRAVPDRAAVGVRGRDGEDAGNGGAVAAPAGGEGQGLAAGGHAVPAPGQRDDLEPAGDEFGDADGALVRLAPGADEHRVVEPRRQQGCQPFGELQHRRRQEAGVEVDRGVEGAADGLGDAGVVVADGGADLPGGEVEQAPPVRGLQPGAGGAGDHVRGELSRVADQR